MRTLLLSLSLVCLCEVAEAYDASCDNYAECISLGDNAWGAMYQGRTSVYLKAIAIELHEIKEILKEMEK